MKWLAVALMLVASLQAALRGDVTDAAQWGAIAGIYLLAATQGGDR